MFRMFLASRIFGNYKSAAVRPIYNFKRTGGQSRRLTKLRGIRCVVTSYVRNVALVIDGKPETLVKHLIWQCAPYRARERIGNTRDIRRNRANPLSSLIFLLIRQFFYFCYNFFTKLIFVFIFLLRHTHLFVSLELGILLANGTISFCSTREHKKIYTSFTRVRVLVARGIRWNYFFIKLILSTRREGTSSSASMSVFFYDE